MRIFGLAAAVCLLAAHGALAAQPIDCAGPLAQARKSIDKVTGDLQGMDKMMPKSAMRQLHRLVGDAQRLIGQADRQCQPGKSAYQQAQAIALATSANGYATAADILHFHYMEEPSGGMQKMGSMKKP